MLPFLTLVPAAGDVRMTFVLEPELEGSGWTLYLRPWLVSVCSALVDGLAAQVGDGDV